MDKPSPLYCAILLTITFCATFITSLDAHYPRAEAGLSTSWINDGSEFYFYPPESYGLFFTPVLLLKGPVGSQFACGFFCPYESGNLCLLGVFILGNVTHYAILNAPRLIWTANRDRPVHINATLQLTRDGDLRLADADGSLVWSTNTSGKSVSCLKLTRDGNLLLLGSHNNNNETVWQSFDYPTDSLVLGQKLFPGQELASSMSASNWSRGVYSISVQLSDGIWVASVGSNPPWNYFKYDLQGNSYLQFSNGSFTGFPLPSALGAQVIKLEPDGHLNVYELGGDGGGGLQWNLVADLLTTYMGGPCGYPTACGKYGICSSNTQCSCPVDGSSTTFMPINYKQGNLGCSLATPISCDQSQYHSLLELTYNRSSYFSFYYSYGGGLVEKKLVKDCKESCLRNCSCKAALFAPPLTTDLAHLSELVTGDCILLSDVYTLINNDGTGSYYSDGLIYVKVQKPPIAVALYPPPPMVSPRKKSKKVKFILGSSLGASFFIVSLVVVASGLFFFRKKRESDQEVDDEFSFGQVHGMPTRFSYVDLKAATNGFNIKLGEGGFGSVFEGTLGNGTKIAVKRLHGVGHVKRSFLAEVETIGSIHHVNLARLIGFCAEKSYRLLVYEYMCNGSLDKWIFHRHHQVSSNTLGWQCRRSIILDIAKGLAYLHEDCRQKILHLDIKPQNILLDEKLNAKVSDFGLAKLINKDQSKVAATLRGTPGYMAPEWLSSIITEKVDVYSFGVVVLEILCGRRNIDRSHPEEDMHLLGVFERKAEQNRLLDMVDKHNDDMQMHGAEVVEMMRVSAWCLQSHFARRPAMSVVVKALEEDSMDVEINLDYKFTYPAVHAALAAVNDEDIGDVDAAASSLLPSNLSGPR